MNLFRNSGEFETTDIETSEIQPCYINNWNSVGGVSTNMPTNKFAASFAEYH